MSMEIRTGDLIDDRYRIIKLLGEGGMALVYEAFDMILKKNVAVKIIKEAERKTADTLNNHDFIDKYIQSNNSLKDKIISEYLSTLNETQAPPKVISGNSSNIYFSPSLDMPKTLKDASEILTKMLK